MKDKILNNEITQKDLDSDEKILNYFRGYFNLYNVSDINAKILFMEKFGISLSNNLSKRIWGIASYITLKERDKRSINILFSYIHIKWILVDNNNKKISKEYFYKVPIENGEFKEKSFIIICNDNMRENMKKNSFRSINFDCTYKCITPTPNKYRLLVLSGYDNLEKKYYLERFKNILKILEYIIIIFFDENQFWKKIKFK